ncbi:hypothetical protein K491DRAFT_756709 [Lophiostoma macrostomum CBS 122681]|uniref:DUF7730 domain-containing protein n=1 Tax=Lophiostoma macrostomum CBS 122681 TaxID=1314788 RepID=A0A6A6TDW9_9PLEO|nr:hypothetical protein K491DRAFT_756709 [Lophiostoma macrostomum CBS 122681]
MNAPPLAPSTSTTQVASRQHPGPNTMDPYLAQASSPLISLLPRELRDKVWKLCVGGHRIHFYWDYGNLQTGADLRSYITDVASERPVNSEVKAEVKGFMPLLLTCRTIHAEASETLYGQNTFDFSDVARYYVTAIRGLPNQFTHESLASISHVEIWGMNVTLPPISPPSPDPGAEFRKWVELWGILVEFKGLRRLKVEIECTAEIEFRVEEFEDAEDEILDPVLTMCRTLTRAERCLKEFELILLFQEKSGGFIGKTLGELGCKVTRSCLFCHYMNGGSKQSHFSIIDTSFPGHLLILPYVPHLGETFVAYDDDVLKRRWNGSFSEVGCIKR